MIDFLRHPDIPIDDEPDFRISLDDLPALDRPAKIEGDEARQVAIAIEVYKRAKAEEKLAVMPWKDLQDKAKEVLAWAMSRLETDSIESDAGRAYVRAPYTRVTYDAAALDALCMSDPELALTLSPHRRERQYEPVLTVR